VHVRRGARWQEVGVWREVYATMVVAGFDFWVGGNGDGEF